MLFVPGAELRVLRILDGRDVLARKTVQQALRLLQHVVQALGDAGVAHRGIRVAHRRSRDHRQVGLDRRDLGRVVDVAREADLGRQLVAARAARVAGQQDRIAGFQSFRRDDEEALRLVRHVVRRRIRGTAILADVRAQEREVADVAREFIVVDVAAEVAHAVGRRVHEAHVADQQLPDAVVLAAAVERGDRAAVGLVAFAFRDQRLDARLDLLVALLAGQPGGQALEHAVRHVLDLLRHVDHGVRAARQLFGAGLGEEAVGDVIVFRRGVTLDRAVAAMVVRDDEAVRRDERCRTARRGDDRAHRVLRQIREALGRDRNADAFQFGFQLRQLVRLPLALVGAGGRGDAQQGYGKDDGFEQDQPRLKKSKHEYIASVPSSGNKIVSIRRN